MILDTFQTVFITLADWIDPDVCIHPRFTEFSIGYDQAKGGNIVYRFTRCRFDALRVAVGEHLKRLRELKFSEVKGGGHG